MTNWYDSIPAPVDANGREVPLDTMELVHKAETRKVYVFVYSIRFRSWFVEFGDLVDIRLSACTLPDSWEKLEEDLGRASKHDDVGQCCRYFTADECANCPIHGNTNSCVHREEFAFGDILDRIRKLTKREGTARDEQEDGAAVRSDAR